MTMHFTGGLKRGVKDTSFFDVNELNISDRKMKKCVVIVKKY